MNTVFRKHLEEIITLTDTEFEQILLHFTVKKLKKHQFVIQAGSLVDHEYFVISGLLRSSYTNEDGKVHIIQFAMENWWISDYHALITQTNAIFDIDCLEDVELLSLSSGSKKKLCAEFPIMEHFFRVKTTAGYVGLQQRILSLLNNDAQSRYQKLFAQYPMLFQRVPKALIASYLGVSRETLSRLSNI
jgi:CRP-like cAMP-binding protein